MVDMSVADVSAWLSALNLGKYAEAFAELDIDGAELILCNDDDLQQYGMKFRVYLGQYLSSCYATICYCSCPTDTCSTN